MPGFDSMYRIERLGGRYTDIKSENSGRHIACRLHPAGLVGLAAIVDGYSGYFSEGLYVCLERIVPNTRKVNAGSRRMLLIAENII
jgi:hypothetical protein